jgi:hypothetical protein
MPLCADIDSLIESMQSVSDEEQFKLMNEFKQEVVQLQEEERMDAMLKLISITQSDNAHEVLEELKSENIPQETQSEHTEQEGTHEIDSHDISSEAVEVEDVQENVAQEVSSSVDLHTDVEIELEENEVTNDD